MAHKGGIEMQDMAACRRRSKSRRFNNDEKTLRWSPTVRDSTNSSTRKALKTSVSSSSSPTPRRSSKAAGYHLFVESPDNKRKSKTSTFPNWLLSCGKRTVNAEDYHVESWSDFHKKHGSHSRRNGRRMTFDEIRKHERQKVTPSFTQRILRRLSGQSSKCSNCGSTQCDSSCSIYSTPSSSTAASKKKRMSPFRRSKP